MSLPSQPFATHEPEVKGRAQPEREPQRQRRLAAAPLTPARVAVATGAGVARHDQLGGHQPPLVACAHVHARTISAGLLEGQRAFTTHGKSGRTILGMTSSLRPRSASARSVMSAWITLACMADLPVRRVTHHANRRLNATSGCGCLWTIPTPPWVGIGTMGMRSIRVPLAATQRQSGLAVACLHGDVSLHKKTSRPHRQRTPCASFGSRTSQGRPRQDFTRPTDRLWTLGNYRWSD